MAKRKTAPVLEASPVDPERVIRITCDPEQQQTRVPLADLEDFQGALKTLSEAATAEFRQNLLTLGYSFPTCLWHGHKLILDGHQRNKVLRLLLHEGYVLMDVDDVPTVSVPVTWIMADSEKEARQKVLAAVSQYGKVSDEGLAEFMKLGDMSWPETEKWVDLPDFDADVFRSNHTDDFSDFDAQVADMAGKEEVSIAVAVPKEHAEEVAEWLANGEGSTGPARGRGVMKRCGLLS